MLDSWESAEIVVGGVNRAAVFDGQSGDMGIGTEVAGQTGPREQVPEDRPMIRTWTNRCDERQSQPFVHVGQRLLRFQRVLENCAPSRDPDEGKNNDPRQANFGRRGKCTLDPLTRRLVHGNVGIDGIDENVGVQEDHFRASIFPIAPSSSSSSASRNARSRSRSGATRPSAAGRKR